MKIKQFNIKKFVAVLVVVSCFFTNIVRVDASWLTIETFQSKFQIVDFSDNMLKTTDGDRYGFMKIDGTIISAVQWDEADDFREGVAIICKDRKYGLLNLDGDIIVDTIYNSMRWMNNQVLLVSKNGKYGCIDIKGKVIIDLQWDNTFVFYEGLAFVKKGSTSYCIDESGKIIFKGEWDKVGYFQNGLAHVINTKNNLYGFIDKKGALALEVNPEYTNYYGIKEKLEISKLNNFEQGIFSFKTSGGGQGYGDVNGTIIYYSSIGNTAFFDYGINNIIVENGISKIMNDNGKVIKSLPGEIVNGLSADCFVLRYSNQLALVHANGDFITGFDFKDVWKYNDTLAIIEKNNLQKGIIDLYGNMVIEPTWDSMMSAGDGLIFAEKNYKWLLIDADNNVVDSEYDWLQTMRNEKQAFVLTTKNKKVGLLDISGNILLKNEWDSIISTDTEDTFLVQKGDTYQVMKLQEEGKTMENNTTSFVINGKQ
ncbi:KWG leptospira [Anaerotignum neopropionicum]|uniref:KWG leptospira n=1 Tax=Anaerotignum neopropionicum TaxID=36847 RepID=A0A136WCM9_9FIRM|nr:WG repeat-containing protein [Anaerotignum neopropionicum]KXL52240.1 KWG leptospira [Anaerotignum neopropionicum]